MTKFRNEPLHRDGIIIIEKWPFFLWPFSTKYCICEYLNTNFNRYGIKSLIRGTYVSMQVYSNGRDEDGQFQDAMWIDLRQIASWQIADIENLILTIQSGGRENV